MPDEIELPEEDLMYDPDSETELNFINLEKESGLSDSDELGSDEVFLSDVYDLSEPHIRAQAMSHIRALAMSHMRVQVMSHPVTIHTIQAWMSLIVLQLKLEKSL